MSELSLLTNHARVLVCIALDREIRLRDIAVALNLTERRVFGIVSELTAGGWVIKEKAGRRTHYQIRLDVPLSEVVAREVTIGEVLELLVGSTDT